jgi:methylglutaconyl-CoA hydratase
MSENLVLYERREPAAVLTMNRPGQRNALSRGLIDALAEAFRRANHDASARCVILTGAGESFCAGMDLVELAESQARREKQEIWGNAHTLSRLFDQIYSLPKPTIAAVNGAAVAGGAGLVSVCDLAVAVPGARLGYPEVRRGLVAAMVMPHLLRHVGERVARYLLLTGDLIDASTALTAGMINEVVPPSQLMERVHTISLALAEGGPKALATTKDLLKRFSRQALSVEETADASAEPRLTEECAQGLDAFFAKRPTPWAPR